MHPTAVVRIFATTQEPDYDNPWQARVPSSASGSGVVIDKNRVLTGAHVVANSTFIQVQKVSDPDKPIAEVVGICHDCDLALLEVDDDTFMEGIEPVELGELPHLRDRVAVVGFPIGGEEISFTEGVVSRIEVQRYSHSQRSLLAVTVDAAINPGNSGGPVLDSEHRVVGIAFQGLDHAENVGHMVPTPIIKNFIASLKPGEVQVKLPAIGIATQGLENHALRKRLDMKDGDSGVLVLTVEHGSSADGVLEPGDAILSIDGHVVANNSTIQFLDRYRTRYDVVVGFIRIGETLPMEILRKGERKSVEITLREWKRLVPRSRYDIEPAYFVYGGLVFQTLTRDFLATWDQWWNKAPKEFLHYYYSGVASPERTEVVILTQILADKINVGYEHFYSEAVTKVNGEPIKDMADFVHKVESSKDRIEILMSSDGLIVYDIPDVGPANERILTRYRITKDRSSGLKS